MTARTAGSRGMAVAQPCAYPFPASDVTVASKWIVRATSWSRRRFAVFSIVAAVVCVVLLILDGLSAAVHFHVGVAVFGVAFFVVLFGWFRIVEARARLIEREQQSRTTPADGQE